MKSLFCLFFSLCFLAHLSSCLCLHSLLNKVNRVCTSISQSSCRIFDIANGMKFKGLFARNPEGFSDKLPVISSISNDKDIEDSMENGNISNNFDERKEAYRVISTVVTGLSKVMVVYAYYQLFKLIYKSVSELPNLVDELFDIDNKNIASSKLLQLLPSDVSLSPNEREILRSSIHPDDIKTTLSDIGGMAEIRELVSDLMMDLVSSNGSETNYLCNGVLLFGPPGCGKTLLVNSACAEASLPIVKVNPSTILRNYIGDSNFALKAVFSLAEKLQPCVIFIDDIDVLLGSRSHYDALRHSELKSEFMQLWDRIKTTQARVLVIGATNRPQDIDIAVQRRFERSSLVPLPNEQDRIEIFHSALRFVPLEPDFDFQTCARLTQDFAPSDIVALCKAAVTTRFRELNSRDKHWIRSNSLGLRSLLQKRKESTTKQTSLDDLPEQNRYLNFSHQPLRFVDIEQALTTVHPTTWEIASYGSISSFGSGS